MKIFLIFLSLFLFYVYKTSEEYVETHQFVSSHIEDIWVGSKSNRHLTTGQTLQSLDKNGLHSVEVPYGVTLQFNEGYDIQVLHKSNLFREKFEIIQ